MILYFTATGNSRFVAERLAEKLADENILSINDVVKYGKDKNFFSEKPFVVVAPVYAWRYPRLVENFVREARFEGSDKIYFVATMGAQSGKTAAHLEKICLKKGVIYGGFRGVVMPDDYVISFKMPTEEEAKKIIRKALPAIDAVADVIEKGEKLKRKDYSPFDFLLTGIVNPVFVKHAASDKDYTVNENCVGCGECVEVCPVNNIVVQNGRPAFLHTCIGCCACIQHCPEQALNAKKTAENGRYLCPKI